MAFQVTSIAFLIVQGLLVLKPKIGLSTTVVDPTAGFFGGSVSLILASLAFHTYYTIHLLLKLTTADLM